LSFLTGLTYTLSVSSCWRRKWKYTQNVTATKTTDSAQKTLKSVTRQARRATVVVAMQLNITYSKVVLKM
jgi:hypothetical protein